MSDPMVPGFDGVGDADTFLVAHDGLGFEVVRGGGAVPGAPTCHTLAPGRYVVTRPRPHRSARASATAFGLKAESPLVFSQPFVL